jgi:hypothetical protein
MWVVVIVPTTVPWGKEKEEEVLGPEEGELCYTLSTTIITIPSHAVLLLVVEEVVLVVAVLIAVVAIQTIMYQVEEEEALVLLPL